MSLIAAQFNVVGGILDWSDRRCSLSRYSPPHPPTTSVRGTRSPPVTFPDNSALNMFNQTKRLESQACRTLQSLIDTTPDLGHGCVV